MVNGVRKRKEVTNNEIKNLAQNILDDEQEAYDNIPEGLQSSDGGFVCMKEIRCENERYNKYFRYKGDTYTEKTGVKLTQDYIDTHVGEGAHEGSPIWKFAWFSNKKDIDGKTYYVFLMI